MLASEAKLYFLTNISTKAYFSKWVSAIFWGFLVCTAVGSTALGVVKSTGKWVWRETKLHQSKGNQRRVC